MSRLLRLFGALVLIAGAAPLSVSVAAQWLSYPTPGAPRTKDGKVDLSATTPRLVNGKPNLSGVWMAAQTGAEDQDRVRRAN